jgi:hypothetical protein
MNEREKELSELRLSVLRRLGNSTASLFGEIAAILQITKRENIREVIQEQTELRADGEEVPLLGELLLMHGMIEPDDIPKILAEQKKVISSETEELTNVERIRAEALRMRRKNRKKQREGSKNER